MTKRTTNRSGFTLTELLVVITIISMLAAISLGGLHAVQQSSNVDRTKRTIQKIHFLLMEKLEEYQTKRVTIDDPNVPDMLERVGKMYDLIRMEMPDRPSDLAILPTASLTNPVALDQEIAATKRYLRKYNNRDSSTDGDPQNSPSAELLYMIIMDMPNAAEQFAEFEIGDADNDGLREFVDAWGNPIKFIRWPVGFTQDKNVVTDLQPFDCTDPANPTLNGAPAPPDLVDPNNVIKYITQNDSDPTASFAVYPLVYSAGPDKKYDTNTGYENYSVPDQHQYTLTPYSVVVNGVTYTYSILNPFEPDGQTKFIGAPIDNEDLSSGTPEDYYDNITNHAIEFGKGR